MSEFINPALFLQVVKDAVAHGDKIIVDGTGDSMRPFIQPETDRITLVPLPKKLKRGDICMYTREAGQIVIHRIATVHDGAYDMQGDNQQLLEKNVPQERLVAQMTERIRNGKATRCDTAAARLRGRLLIRRKHAKMMRKEYLRVLKKKLHCE